MTYGNYALIIVDVQYDFLPGGALGVPDGDKVIHPLVLAAHGASLVVASRDWHPDNHFSFSDDPQYIDGSWPPHCIQKTKGARIYPALNKLANFVISKGMNRNPPDAYSAFVGKTLRPVRDLEEILHASPIETVVVGGLALDYCVRYTAHDAAAFRYRTVVPLDCTRPVGNPTETLEGFERAGVEVVDHFVA